MLTVTQPAADGKLLSAEQMRLAAGLAADDTSQDAGLTVLNDRVSADIVSACRVAVANGAEPTLRQETLLQRFQTGRGAPGPLILARRHNVAVLALTVDGQPLQQEDWLLESEAGLLTRMQGDCEASWTGRITEVSYRAGFEAVPPALLGAASDLFRLRQSETSRDPLAKRERIDVDGVEAIETEFWVSAVGSAASPGPVPAEILARLSRFINVGFG